MALEKNNNTCIAEQHYLALQGERLAKIEPFFIDKSFINCSKSEPFDEFNDGFELVLNGYFEDNPSSNFRKVFDKSILDDLDFEKTY